MLFPFFRLKSGNKAMKICINPGLAPNGAGPGCFWGIPKKI